MRNRARFVSALAALALAACSGGGAGQGTGAADAGTSNDGRAGADSAAMTDVPDDAWTEPDDGPVSDEGQPDAGQPDEGPAPDEGPPDEGPAPDEGLPDGGPADEGPAPDQEPPPEGLLAVSCAVPYVLDANKMAASDLVYMGQHYADLVQEYCILGTVLDVDLSSYVEKMYYGSHAPGSSVISLQQLSMDKGLLGLDPKYSVRIDFSPLSSFTKGSEWEVGVDAGEAMVILFRHEGLKSICTLGVGTGGSLEVTEAEGVQKAEGGTFTVAGEVEISKSQDVPAFCSQMQGSQAPCCPKE